MSTIGENVYDNLFSGSAEIVTGSIIAGETLSRGDVIGIETSSGKGKKVNSSLVDGTEKPYAIVADVVESDKPVCIYLTGEFNENVLTFGGTDDADKHRVALREIGIFLNKDIGI